jgi:hypothetical protein
MKTKICNVCKTEKPVSEFHKRGNGYKHACKPCRKKQSAANYEAKKEYILARNKAWKKANPEKFRKISNDWTDRNRDKARRYWRESNKRHKARCTANAVKYVATKIKATPSWIDNDLVKDMYKEAEYFQMEVDHIVPLRSKYVCGLHWEGNLQLLSREDNRKKSNRLWENMWHLSREEREQLEYIQTNQGMTVDQAIAELQRRGALSDTYKEKGDDDGLQEEETEEEVNEDNPQEVEEPGEMP